jgi:two-component system sensor histidine kinase GlrK
MRTSTKIIAGYGIMIALMAGLVAFYDLKIRRMQSISTNVQDTYDNPGLDAISLIRNMDLVEEFTRKSFLFPVDPDYRQKLQESCALFESYLRKIETSSSEKLKAASQELSASWRAFSEELARRQEAVPSKDARDVPNILVEYLDQLKAKTESTYGLAVAGAQRDVTWARKAREDALRVTWIVAAIALLLGGLVSFIIVQSISTPLKQLTQGTRAIAEGKFFYRLDTTRNDEFGHLAKDFNTMTQRLNELDQMKRDFVSHISHELKAPLASMQETIQLLLEEIPGPLSDKQRRLLELNLESGRRLSAMIGNLLDLSRMEAGVMEYELKANDLTALVRTAAADLQPQAGERELTLTVDVSEQPVMVECDGDRIIQVARNLIGNAIKFSPKGRQIGIRVAYAPAIPADMPDSWRGKILSPPDGDSLAVVTVTDSGPGVPDQHKERIFEKFHQVKQGKKIPGQGAGLGLAICRTITEAHRGAIWVADNSEGGSIFYLVLSKGECGEDVTYRASSPI